MPQSPCRRRNTAVSTQRGCSAARPCPLPDTPGVQCGSAGTRGGQSAFPGLLPEALVRQCSSAARAGTRGGQSPFSRFAARGTRASVQFCRHSAFSVLLPQALVRQCSSAGIAPFPGLLPEALVRQCGSAGIAPFQVCCQRHSCVSAVPLLRAAGRRRRVCVAKKASVYRCAAR